jgi:hypothetical protein
MISRRELRKRAMRQGVALGALLTALTNLKDFGKIRIFCGECGPTTCAS